MKKLIRYLIYLIIIITIVKLVGSNPTREEYNFWIAEQATNNSNNLLVETIVNLVADPILNSSTTHTDYIILSVFETDLTGIGMEKFKVIGIFDKFIPISNTSTEMDEAPVE